MELQLTYAQKQILSQRMIQSTEILQMNQQELETYIEQQSLENPLIEPDLLNRDYREEDTERQEVVQRSLEWLGNTDRQNRVYYKEDFRDSEERDSWNLSADKGEELSEYVYAQLIPWMETERDRRVYYYLTQSLDSRGYCTETPEDLELRYGLTEEEAEGYLSRLRGADPAGVGAKDLSMCLLLQLERLGKASPDAKILVEECLELMGKNQLGKIAARLSLPMEETLILCELVRGLNPKPGSGFASRENMRYIYPEIAVVTFKDYFQVVLNESRMPKIRINETYKNILQGELPEDAREYITTKLRQAEWITQCIEQRQNTLTSVMKAVVEMQEPFFRLGPGHRKPLRMLDVAEKLGLHESTISRAVREKYVQCHWGVYPLSYFFMKSFGGEDQTVEAVKQAMRKLLSEEDSEHPLSDQKISDRLKLSGIEVSRRTVAKYRSEMGIRDAGGRKIHSKK